VQPQPQTNQEYEAVAVCFLGSCLSGAFGEIGTKSSHSKFEFASKVPRRKAYPFGDKRFAWQQS
jgi:hypothetical protein